MAQVMHDFFNPSGDTLLGMIMNSVIGLVVFIGLEVMVASELARYFIALFTALSCALIAQFAKMYLYPKFDKYVKFKFKVGKNAKKD